MSVKELLSFYKGLPTEYPSLSLRMTDCGIHYFVKYYRVRLISYIKIKDIIIYTILGIESSCDDTAIAVVRGEAGACPQILAQAVWSQNEQHSPYAGVVPEIAARAHAEIMPILLEKVMTESGVSYEDLSAVAATYAPGLIGGVIVGLMTAKGIAIAADKPLIAVNHLEGHALSPRITHDVAFPYLLFLASGGHCQFIIVKEIGDYDYLGGTIDDALGEAFDKVAKMLGLGFPGGAIVEQYAKSGSGKRFKLPRPLWNSSEANFSFSGLKTAVLRIIESGAIQNQQDIADLCASFQQTVWECIENRLQLVVKLYQEKTGDIPKRLVMAGGVAANQFICGHLQNFADSYQVNFFAPPMRYCTDNAVMIAYAGLEHFARGHTSPLSIKPLARIDF